MFPPECTGIHSLWLVKWNVLLWKPVSYWRGTLWGKLPEGVVLTSPLTLSLQETLFSRVLSALPERKTTTLGHFGVKSDGEGRERSPLCVPPLLCFADISVICAAGFLFSLRTGLLPDRDGEFGLDTMLAFTLSTCSVLPHPLGPGFIVARPSESRIVSCRGRSSVGGPPPWSWSSLCLCQPREAALQ